ncbi:MAG: GAF domain-containing protein [Anaerolineae bacterium]
MRTTHIPLYKSLRVRLFIALAFVALVSVGVIGLAAYQNASANLESRVTAQLTSIADLKQEQIITWLQERQADARSLAENQMMQHHLAEILSPDTPSERRAVLTDFVIANLKAMRQSRQGYSQILFVDTQGLVVLATDPSLIGEIVVHEVALSETLASPGGAFMEDIHFEPELGQIEMEFGHVVRGINLDTLEELPEVIGAVIIEVRMEETIYPLIRAWPGMGGTGETLLVRAEDDTTLFLNDLRFAEDAALHLRLPVDSPDAKPAHLASRGAEGIIQTRDYRGVPVLAAYRHIPGINWGFVAKQDLDEAFAPVNALAHRTWLIGLIVLLVAGLASIVLAQTLTRPLAQLVGAARAIAAGNLQTEVSVEREDEIGALAKSFKKMVNSLQQRQEQLQLANEAALGIASTLSLGRALQKIVDAARDLGGARYAALAVYDETDQIKSLITAGLPSATGGDILSSHSRPALNLLLGQQATQLREADKDPHQREDDAPSHFSSIRNFLGFPIRGRERTLGALYLTEKIGAAGFNQADEEVIANLAAYAAVALENAQLYETAQRRADELETLFGFALAVRAAGTVDEILSIALKQAIRAVGGIWCSIYLVEPETGELILKGSLPKIPEDSPDMRFRPGEGIADRVAKTGEIYIAEDLTLDMPARMLPGEAKFLEAIRGTVALPLRTQERMVGVLNIGLPPPRTFTPEEVRLLGAMAEIAGNALHRARVLESLEMRVEERTRELAQANERLKELDRLKSKFVSEVSHELRTPVTNLKLYLDLLERTGPEKRGRIQAVLRDQTDRLGQLIEDILDLSRLELGGKRVQFAPVDLNQVVERVVSVHSERARAAGLQLEFSPDPSLPLIQGERNQLSQVVTNLVANAINYTHAGRIQVRTFCNGRKDRVCLEVEDTGMGIEPEDMPHLFERFYRGVHSREIGVPGTGLGLGIVKDIVDIHNGMVDVKSKIGVGSTFQVWLPVAADDGE